MPADKTGTKLSCWKAFRWKAHVITKFFILRCSHRKAIQVKFVGARSRVHDGFLRFFQKDFSHSKSSNLFPTSNHNGEENIFLRSKFLSTECYFQFINTNFYSQFLFCSVSSSGLPGIHHNDAILDSNLDSNLVLLDSNNRKASALSLSQT